METTETPISVTVSHRAPRLRVIGTDTVRYFGIPDPKCEREGKVRRWVSVGGGAKLTALGMSTAKHLTGCRLVNGNDARFEVQEAALPELIGLFYARICAFIEVAADREVIEELGLTETFPEPILKPAAVRAITSQYIETVIQPISGFARSNRDGRLRAKRVYHVSELLVTPEVHYALVEAANSPNRRVRFFDDTSVLPLPGDVEPRVLSDGEEIGNNLFFVGT